jgi:hypothetical protein
MVAPNEISHVDIFPTSLGRAHVYVYHGSTATDRTVNARAGLAARDAARTMSYRIEEATGRKVRVHARREGERQRTHLFNCSATWATYRLTPQEGEFRTSTVITWPDRPVDVVAGVRSAQRMIHRHGLPVSVIRRLMYWWDEGGERKFAVIRESDITSHFQDHLN